MIRIVRILLGLGMIGGAVAVSYLLYLSRPQAEVENRERSIPAVEVLQLAKMDREMSVPSQGLIEARRVSQLAVEVQGLVIEVSDKFDKGGEFAEGELMLKVDPYDYRTSVKQAEASLADARLSLATEEAKAEQAKRDWESLGRPGKATDLTLRIPQLANARARVAAAESALAKAEHDLERTEIKAPFAGRIRQLHTEVGSFLVPGSRIAEYYTTEPYELRMPVSLNELQFVSNVKEGGKGAEVEVATRAGGDISTWKGEVIRNESEVERASRSIYLVAELKGRSEEGGIRLQPGLFVQAEIEGEIFKGVFEVPMKAFVDLENVMVVDQENRIQLRQVRVLRRYGDMAVVSDGLKHGERVCLTALVDVIDGMEVRIVKEEGSTGDGGKKTERAKGDESGNLSGS